MTTYRLGREAAPAQYLFAQAQQSLRRAESEPEGSKLECMNAMIMAAFALESFLNVFGEQVFAERYGEKSGHQKWQEIERGLNPQGKLDLLIAMKSLSVDTSAEPYTLVRSLIKYRNDCAHGKTWRSKDVVVDLPVRPHPNEVPALTPPWFKLATVGTARKYMNAVRTIADDLLLRTDYLRGLRISDTAWHTTESVIEEDS